MFDLGSGVVVMVIITIMSWPHNLKVYVLGKLFRLKLRRLLYLYIALFTSTPVSAWARPVIWFGGDDPWVRD